MTLLYWMLGAAGIAVLIAIAAATLEWSGSFQNIFGATRRWLWCAALITSVLLPVILLARAPVDSVIANIALGAPSATNVANTQISLALAILLWTLLSLGTAAVFLGSQRSLMRAATHWRPQMINDLNVLVSQDFGPAVIGFRNSRIVIPEWTLQLSEGDRSTVLLHEREHLEARDQSLLFFGTMLTIIFPWNPAIWYQLHRLKCAIELDCDARVVARTGNKLEYANLLLRVAPRAFNAAGTLALVPRTFAGVRIETLVAPRVRSAPAQHLTALVSAACVIGVVFVPLPRLGNNTAAANGDTLFPQNIVWAQESRSADSVPNTSALLLKAQQLDTVQQSMAHIKTRAIASTANDSATQQSASASSEMLERAGLDSLSYQLRAGSGTEMRAGGVQRGGMSLRAIEVMKRVDSIRASIAERGNGRSNSGSAIGSSGNPVRSGPPPLFPD